MTKIISTIILLLLIITPNKAGPAFLACEVACSGYCWPWNALVGPGEAAYLACMVGCTALCVGTCFSESALVNLKSNDKVIEQVISNIRPGDLIKTLVNQTEVWTRVINNQKTNGQQPFVEITLNSGVILKTTPEHGIIIKEGNSENIVVASNLELGQKLINGEGLLESIISLRLIEEENKYTLETAEGTALVNNILTTTICAGEWIEEDSLDLTLKNWKETHKTLLAE